MDVRAKKYCDTNKTRSDHHIHYRCTSLCLFLSTCIEFIPFFQCTCRLGHDIVMSWVTISVGACILLPLQLTLTHQANTSIAAYS